MIPETPFVDDLNADSVNLIELAMVTEEEFVKRLEMKIAEKIQTVQDTINYIKTISDIAEYFFQ